MANHLAYTLLYMFIVAGKRMSDAKLIIRKESKGTVIFKPVQLYVETHELVADLAEETGIPKAKLIDMMVRFAVEHMEIVGGENDER